MSRAVDRPVRRTVNRADDSATDATAERTARAVGRTARAVGRHHAESAADQRAQAIGGSAVGSAVDPAVPLARAAGTLLILYGTLLGLWADQHGQQSLVLTAIRHWFNRPLGIGQDFTMLGVMLLLLAAGYQSRPAGRAIRSGRMLASRLVRLYAPILGATTLAALLTQLPVTVWTTPAGLRAGPGDFLRGLGLVDQVVSGQRVLVPLAWVVALEIVSWLVAMLPVRLPAVVEAIQLVAVAGVLVAAARGQFGQLAVVLSSYPLVVVGQLIRRARDGEQPLWVTLLLTIGAWALLGWAEHVCPPVAGWWYPLTAAYAMPLFAIAVLTGGDTARRVAENPMVDWLATRARWIVLLAGVVGFPILGMLLGRVSPLVAVLPAAAAAGLVAEAGHRLATWRAR